MMEIRYFACIVLLALSLGLPSGAQGPAPHALAYCVNHAGFPEYPMEDPHICLCQPRCGPNGERIEDRGCLTYCRTPNCHCLHEDCRPPETP